MAEYKTFWQYEYDLRKAVQPYRNLLQSELKTVDYGQWWHAQKVSSFWDYAQAHKCDHIHSEPVRWTLSNGVERVALQCMACGHKNGTGVRKADYPDFDELPEIDEGLVEDAREAWQDFTETLREVYNEAHAQFERQQTDAIEREKAARNSEWWDRYNEYLKTPEWQSKRQRVLDRDGHICQACLRREAEHVHHLTYDHVFNEPLFDLISVCYTCHAGLHPHMQEARHAQAA